MSDLHIDDFYRDTAKILTLLYSHFPRTMTLYVEDISGPDTPDEFGLHSPRHEATLHSMLWLGSTGYLEFSQTARQEGIDDAVLTHQAFLLLNAACPSNKTHELPQPGELTIHKMRYELKHGTSDTLAAFMRKAMEGFNQRTN